MQILSTFGAPPVKTVEIVVFLTDFRIFDLAVPCASKPHLCQANNEIQGRYSAF